MYYQLFARSEVRQSVEMSRNEVLALVREVRGEEVKPAAPKIDPRYPELTGQGRVVSSALKQGK